MKRTILITGGTGFVGSRLVKRLVGEDRPVRVLVRDPGRLDPQVAGKVETVVGSLGDEAATIHALKGVDTVLNLAALATAFDRDPERYFRVNAQGLEVLLAAAEAAQVNRFVHVSTVAVLPPAHRPKIRGLSGRPTPYARSKLIAEELVQKYVDRGLHAMIVRPTRVYGPGPWNDANGTTRLVAMYLQGTFRFRLQDSGARANYVHVDDVVAGILQAAAKGRPGGAYMLGGEDATLEQFLDLIARLTGVRRRVWALPPEVMVPVAHLCKLWGRLGGRTSLTPGWLNNFLEDRPVDSSKTTRDLDYCPRNLRRGLQQTLAWLLTDDEGNGHGNLEQENHRGVRVRVRDHWA